MYEPPPVDEARASGIEHEIEARGRRLDVVEVDSDSLDDVAADVDARAKGDLRAGPAQDIPVRKVEAS